MLTAHDRLTGKRWFIVGTRVDGSRLLIEEAARKRDAQARARIFERCLEGYRRIDVERAGEVPTRQAPNA